MAATGSPPSKCHGPRSVKNDEVLALSPAALLDAVIPAGAASDDWGTAGLALALQLRAAGVPAMALELCLVGLHNTRDVALREGIMAPAREHLNQVVETQSRGVPALETWMSAIRDRVVRLPDLEVAIELLGRARSTWLTVAAMEAAPRPTYGKEP